MKTRRFLALCTSLTAFAAQAETLLTQGPPLAENIAAFPRLTGNDPAALKINALFAAMDADEPQWLLDCDGGRDITVTAETADFLSLTVDRGGNCEGAAHPFHDTEAMTFDRISGDEADWQVLLPQFQWGSVTSGNDKLHPVASQSLKIAYLAALSDTQPNCSYAYAQPLYFSIWLDSDRQALGLLPSLAYVFTPCSEVAYLPLSQLQGANPRLIAALSGVE